jgi:hypothetical protein
MYGFPLDRLWVMGYRGVWIMYPDSLQTKLVEQAPHGICRSMCYQGYGIRGSLLYYHILL